MVDDNAVVDDNARKLVQDSFAQVAPNADLAAAMFCDLLLNWTRR